MYLHRLYLKPFALLLVLLLSTAASFAQWHQPLQFGFTRQHNVSFSAHGGPAMLMLNDAFSAPSKLGFAAGANLGYTLLFNKNVGVLVGIGASFTKSGFLDNDQRSSYDDDVATYNDYTTYNGFGRIDVITGEVSEQFKTLTVDIPLQLAFQYNYFFANAGVRFMMPFSVAADYDYSRSTRGVAYFYETGADLSADPVPLGARYELPAQSGSYDAYSFANEDPFIFFLNLAVEMGYRKPMPGDASLYIGCYLDYSLNSVKNSYTNPFIAFTDSAHEVAKYSGAMHSNLVESYRYFSAGIKVAYSMTFGRRLR